MPIASVVDLLTCPHCRRSLVLTSDGGGVHCAEGHRFDLARQGYLNLSAGPQPANADTTAMVAARERFLAGGFFDPISEAARRLTAPEPGIRILDAGAGTGRLLAALLDAAGGSGRPGATAARGVALDVSTAAARRSARAYPQLGAVVADVWRAIPLLDAALDLVVSNFAPRNASEFARVLAPGGHLLTISPTTEHLARLRRTYGLLEIQADKADRLAATLTQRFEPVTQERIEFRARWAADVVRDAIAMGPNAFHHDPERPTPRPADVTVSVCLRLWRR